MGSYLIEKASRGLIPWVRNSALKRYAQDCYRKPHNDEDRSSFYKDSPQARRARTVRSSQQQQELQCRSLRNEYCEDVEKLRDIC